VSLVLIALAIVIYNRSRRSVYQRAATNEPLGDIELDELTL
jgi:cbb3-type cytochrome oxidase subunit 3